MTAALAKDTIKWTFSLCCVLVREQIVVYHLPQSVPVVDLCLKVSTFVPVLSFDLWFINAFYELERQVRFRDDGGSVCLWNIVTCVPDYTASHPRCV